jgi:predicted nuclease with TOPRIM domain
MAEKEVSEALFTLRGEVERLEGSNPELKAKLEGLLDELEDNLEATEDVNHLHLVEDMQEAISQFEVEHPRLTGIVNELMVALSNMGI